MMEKLMAALFGSQHERDLKQLLPILQKINDLETWAMGLPEQAFPEQTAELRQRLEQDESLDDLLPEAFALAREAGRRTLGERSFDTQLLGGIVLHQGKIMEMKTGEGKTLSAVAAAYLNSLPGRGVHVVTVNDYLAERDAAWMRPVYRYLGVSVGTILSQMDTEARHQAYDCDITYGTNNEFGFDYLRDNMRWDTKGKAQKLHNYCIIDEIDSILIDEARTPLIISGAAEDDTAKFRDVNRLISSLKECEKDPETGEYPEEPVGDFKLEEKGKRVTFTDEGMNHVEDILLKNRLITGSLFLENNFEYIHYFTQALTAHHLFHRDKDYVVQEGKVQIVDEFTGRILTGRRYSNGLHQAIEAKERIKVAQRNRTLATITFQNFFRMYDKIAGMTGTADTEAKEFAKIYSLEVTVIPTNRPLARKDEDDVIYLNEGFKLQAICDEIEKVNTKGQPILIGTISIEKSELLSKQLTRRGIRHEVLNAKNHAREAIIIAEAGAKGAVTIATNMAGRGTDIKLGGNAEYRARRSVGTEATPEEYRQALEKETEKWRADYEEVKSLGGLYILGTERHESRRIDNQLRGRSGRQGDPGVSRFFISLDDDLMRLFSDNLKPMMARLGMEGGEPIFHPWINKAIERAQTKVEERNFEIRKHLLDYDDVLNEQRNFIYRQRDEILVDTRLCDRILDAAEEVVEDNLDTYYSGKESYQTLHSTLSEELKRDFFYQLTLSSEEVKGMQRQELKQTIMDALSSDMQDKIAKVGEAQLNQFVRMEYLRSIDNRWQEHLEQLEALREAVSLRAYAQKNPLLEYKLEGFDIFDQLIYTIKTGIAKRILKMRIERADSDRHARAAVPQGQESHARFGLLGSGPTAKQRSQAVPDKAQIKRTVPKVGRNDPCPCGSGKKYKHCHGM